MRMLLFLYSDGNEMDPTNSSYATYTTIEFEEVLPEGYIEVVPHFQQ